jgi:hypothetical protein
MLKGRSSTRRLGRFSAVERNEFCTMRTIVVDSRRAWRIHPSINYQSWRICYPFQTQFDSENASFLKETRAIIIDPRYFSLPRSNFTKRMTELRGRRIRHGLNKE